jgi:hypothetical protein
MTPRSNPEQRSLSEVAQDVADTLRTLEAGALDALADDLERALTASASGGEEEKFLCEFSDPAPGTVFTEHSYEPPMASELFDPSAPTYNVSRLEFDILNAEVRCQRAWINEMRAKLGMEPLG